MLPALAAISCQKDQIPDTETTTLALISDQVHNQGTSGFFFLPPMIAQPTVVGAFLGTLSSVVRIDELDGSLKLIQTIATYTTTTGPGSETVRVTTDPLYIVNWHTDYFTLNNSHFYRINVLVGQRVLGFADVEPVASGGQMKNVNTNQYIALVDGKTLPIKFWTNGCAPVSARLSTSAMTPAFATLGPSDVRTR